MTQEIYVKEISSMDFPQHGVVFYFYGQAIKRLYKFEFGIPNQRGEICD
jgi:hypothetical protein